MHFQREKASGDKEGREKGGGGEVKKKKKKRTLD